MHVQRGFRRLTAALESSELSDERRTLRGDDENSRRRCCLLFGSVFIRHARDVTPFREPG